MKKFPNTSGSAPYRFKILNIRTHLLIAFRRLLVTAGQKLACLRPHYLKTDWTKIQKFYWWVVIDVVYIITKNKSNSFII